jgi:hypothetical protein
MKEVRAGDVLAIREYLDRRLGKAATAQDLLALDKPDPPKVSDWQTGPDIDAVAARMLSAQRDGAVELELDAATAAWLSRPQNQLRVQALAAADAANAVDDDADDDDFAADDEADDDAEDEGYYRPKVQYRR